MAPDTAIGADELAAIEEQLGAGWERNVHYRPPAGTEVETDAYSDELVLAGPDAPFRMEPHHVEWWRDNGDALQVSCRERTYRTGGEGPGGALLEWTHGLEAAETYLQEELGYEEAVLDTETVI